MLLKHPALSVKVSVTSGNAGAVALSPGAGPYNAVRADTSSGIPISKDFGEGDDSVRFGDPNTFVAIEDGVLASGIKEQLLGSPLAVTTTANTSTPLWRSRKPSPDSDRTSTHGADATEGRKGGIDPLITVTFSRGRARDTVMGCERVTAEGEGLDRENECEAEASLERERPVMDGDFDIVSEEDRVMMCRV